MIFRLCYFSGLCLEYFEDDADGEEAEGELNVIRCAVSSQYNSDDVSIE